VLNYIFLRAFLNKISYELWFGRPHKVSHLRLFGCRCFVLKQENLDKFESRSSNGVFLGYALHSRAYHVLNLETNHIMETCVVTFNETAPCTSPVFEPIGPDQMGHTIFVEEEHTNDDWGDTELTLLAVSVKRASNTLVNGPDPASSTTWCLVEPEPAEPRDCQATIESDATSSREAPQHI
jgi:hypothetical protein